MSYTELMDGVARGFEVGGVLVLVAGFVWALLRAMQPAGPGEERDEPLHGAAPDVRA